LKMLVELEVMRSESHRDKEVRNLRDPLHTYKIPLPV